MVITQPLCGLFYLSSILLLTGCNSEPNNIALGTLERERIAHTATVNEVVVDLPIPQGQRVQKGDVLVQLDNRLQLALTAKASANVAEAQANLEKLRNGARVEDVAAASAKLEGAKAALLESEIGYKRNKNLVEQGLISQATLDQALAAKDANIASVQAAKEELLKLTNGTRPEDLLIGKAHLAAMEAVLANETKKLSDLTIVATRDGILDNLPWNLGERVTQGSPLAVVLAGVAPYARIYVPEPYRIHIATGDTLQVKVDGLTQSIAGKVRWISSDPAFTPYYALNQEERARLMYLAEVQLPDEYAHLPNGVGAQVELP
ncbi:HlyD family efflux transporter periplasmic adaptor subunit [Psychrosphaera sp. F3M07]|nr:HlyD family efflux transporter periplasmic adaptor subunit [Psychrosphaera sp. F3M07]